MKSHNIVVDSSSLEKLSGILSALPKDVNAAIKASLKAGTVSSLKKYAAAVYTITQKQLSGTHYITQRYHSGSSDGQQLQYEVVGRRLTPAHFVMSPLEHRGRDPRVEIITGEPHQAAPQKGKDGKLHSPFVMRTTKAKATDNKFGLNIFVRTGEKTSKGTDKLYAYRTVSVPQMLENPQVAKPIADNLAEVFDVALFKRLENRLDIAAAELEAYKR